MKDHRFVKRLLVSLFLLLCCRLDAGTAKLDFEDLPLPANTSWNGTSGEAGFNSSGVFLPHAWQGSFDWTGFAYSKLTDTQLEGQTGQHTAYPGGGAEGSATYGIACTSASGNSLLRLPEAAYLSGVYLANTNFAYYALTTEANTYTEWDYPGKKFGPGDLYYVDIIGFDENYHQTGTVRHYMAYGSDIKTEWEWVRLSDLGKVRYLRFYMNSNDQNINGMRQPPFVCFDSLVWTTGSGTAGFESVGMGGGTTRAGELGELAIPAGPFVFSNSTDSGGALAGFGVSKLNSSGLTGTQGRYQSRPGAGAWGTEAYAVARVGQSSAPTIFLPYESAISGFAIANSEETRTAFASFGPASYFRVVATGYSATGRPVGSVKASLAEGTTILEGWKWLNLHSLGRVKKVVLDVETSDPAVEKVFCIDSVSLGNFDSHGSGFEDFGTASGKMNPDEGTGGFGSGAAVFYSTAGSTAGTWTGLVFSADASAATGFDSRYSAAPGGGIFSSTAWTVGSFSSEPVEAVCLAEESIVSGFWITLSSYTISALENGTDGSKSYTPGDIITVRIQAYDNTGGDAGTVAFNLVDSAKGILKKWAWVDLTSLKPAKTLHFSVQSNIPDGQKPPMYFCLDGIRFNEEMKAGIQALLGGSGTFRGTSFGLGGASWLYRESDETGFSLSGEYNSSATGSSGLYATPADSAMFGSRGHVVLRASETSPAEIRFSNAAYLSGVGVNFSAAAFYAIRDGASVAGAFSSADSFQIVAEGYDASGTFTGRVTKTLVNGSNPSLLWQWMNLSSLGAVKSLRMYPKSSRSDTPLSLCLDHFSKSSTDGGVVDAEDIVIAGNSAWFGDGVYDSFGSGALVLATTRVGGDYSGFGVSTITDTTEAGITGTTSSCAGGGVGGSGTYFTAKSGTLMPQIAFPKPAFVSGAAVSMSVTAFKEVQNLVQTNSAFAANGYLYLTATGYDSAGTMTTTTAFEFKYSTGISGTSSVQSGWEWFDLSELGKVQTISFALTSSGGVAFSISPSFCMDQLYYSYIDHWRLSFEQTLQAPQSAKIGKKEANGGAGVDGYGLSLLYNAGLDTWGGFAFSNVTNSLSTGSDERLTAKPGTGALNTDSFLVAHTAFGVNPRLTLPKPAVVTGLYIANTVWSWNVMKYGEGDARAFVAGDYLEVTLRGFDQSGGQKGYQKVRLGNGTDILDSWKFVDLSGFGEVKYIQFESFTTDFDYFGYKTPLYYCVDEISILNPGYDRENFDSLPIAVHTTFTGSRHEGGFQDDNAYFNNVWSSNLDWSGFALSSLSETATPDTTRTVSSGGAYDGNTYAIAKSTATAAARIRLVHPRAFASARVSNIRSNLSLFDGMDSLTVKAVGYDSVGNYKAETSISLGSLGSGVSGWTLFPLSVLGVVHRVDFSVESNDSSMLTSFALDHLKYSGSNVPSVKFDFLHTYVRNGQTISLPISYSDPDGFDRLLPVFQVNGTGLTALSQDNATANYEFTPTESGVYQLTAFVSDGERSVSITTSVSVIFNETPSLSYQLSARAPSAGREFSLFVTANDKNSADVLTVEVSADGAVLPITKLENRKYEVKLSRDTPGQFTCIGKVSDGILTTTRSFNIIVYEPVVADLVGQLDNDTTERSGSEVLDGILAQTPPNFLDDALGAFAYTVEGGGLKNFETSDGSTVVLAINAPANTIISSSGQGINVELIGVPEGHRVALAILPRYAKPLSPYGYWGPLIGIEMMKDDVPIKDDVDLELRVYGVPSLNEVKLYVQTESAYFEPTDFAVSRISDAAYSFHLTHLSLFSIVDAKATPKETFTPTKVGSGGCLFRDD